MMVDEADIDMVGSTTSSSTSSAGGLSTKGIKRTLASIDGCGLGAPRAPPNKRKPGPIPKDVVIRRPSYSTGNRTPSSTPSSSPISSPTSSPISSPMSSPLSSPVPWEYEPKSPCGSGGIIDGNVPSYSTSLTVTCNTPNSIATSPTLLNKLVNGLAEIPAIPVFEPIPVETNETATVVGTADAAVSPSLPETSPTQLTPGNTIITNSIGSTAKMTTNVINERKTQIDSAVNTDLNKININDSANDNDTCVDSDSALQERLTNHMDVEEQREDQTDKIPTKKELEEIRRHNLSIRELVYKEVRRRGTSKSSYYLFVDEFF